MHNLEKEILEFATNNWGEKDLCGIGLKLGEECGEIQGAIVKIPEGRATEQDLKDEIGDSLIVLSQLAAKMDTTLDELRFGRLKTIVER
jgi:NTP pyrophosphatase (non-canonical NTP hydrolase)